MAARKIDRDAGKNRGDGWPVGRRKNGKKKEKARRVTDDVDETRLNAIIRRNRDDFFANLRVSEMKCGTRRSAARSRAKREIFSYFAVASN